ncbi:MAG: class I SAM-dependent methyltransferase [Nitrosarchaeum sp.]
MSKIKFIAKKILGRDKIKSIGKDYWEKAAHGNVQKTMNKICDGFDQESFETKKESIIFLEEFQLSIDYVVLDLACGMGRTCRWVAPKVKEYVGVDFIPEMIEKAKKYNSDFLNAKFLVNDGKTLNIFSDKIFDLVFCEIAFQHMPRDVQKSYVSEVYRILNEKGIFFVQLPRIEYYKDSTFAFSKEEADSLLKNFKIKYLHSTPAYYHIQAKKLNDMN